MPQRSQTAKACGELALVLARPDRDAYAILRPEVSHQLRGNVLLRRLDILLCGNFI